MSEMDSSYSKKSPFVWIVVYVLIGLAVYGAIYYFAFYKKANNDYAAVEETSEMVSEEADPETAPIENVTVTLTEEGFDPSEITISEGATVTWVNESGEMATVNSGPHPEHTEYPPLNLEEFEAGQTVSLTFDSPGTYAYHNHYNEDQTGTVTVE